MMEEEQFSGRLNCAVCVCVCNIGDGYKHANKSQAELWDPFSRARSHDKAKGRSIGLKGQEIKVTEKVIQELIEEQMR